MPSLYSVSINFGRMPSTAEIAENSSKLRVAFETSLLAASSVDAAAVFSIPARFNFNIYSFFRFFFFAIINNFSLLKDYLVNHGNLSRLYNSQIFLG